MYLGLTNGLGAGLGDMIRSANGLGGDTQGERTSCSRGAADGYGGSLLIVKSSQFKTPAASASFAECGVVSCKGGRGGRWTDSIK